MTKRRAIDPADVLEAACELAEELGTTPPQSMIADRLGCSRPYISHMFVALEYAGVIEWVTRYAYTIKDAQWIPPPKSHF